MSKKKSEKDKKEEKAKNDFPRLMENNNMNDQSLQLYDQAALVNINDERIPYSYDDPEIQFFMYKNNAFDVIRNNVKRLGLNEKNYKSLIKNVYDNFYTKLHEVEDGSITIGLQSYDQIKNFLRNYLKIKQRYHIEGFDNFLKRLQEEPVIEQQIKINETQRRLNFQKKKAMFTNEKIDYELIDFIDEALNDENNYLEKRIELEKIKKPENDNDKVMSKNFEFEWCGNKNDLVELVYGLIEAGVLRYTDKKMVVKGFASFLGVNIEDPNTQLQAIKKRKVSNNSQTELLDKMKQKLSLYLNKLT